MRPMRRKDTRCILLTLPRAKVSKGEEGINGIKVKRKKPFQPLYPLSPLFPHQLLFLKERHRLYMRRMWKQIHRLHRS